MAVKSKTCAVKVLNAEFYKQYTSDTLPISTAKLTIKNESTCTITKIYCKGKLTTHNTNTVLIEDSFSFDLASSLAPGEQNIYDIPLNSFGGWAKVFPPDLSVFCVVIDGIETTDGKAFVSSFSSKDQKRLDKLKKKYT
ncbi:MAG: hypothetical protein LBU29_04415 [Endomicrobium sp.]|jgi:hypothetical protein|nr:hypothetical protein [Endomicrobium sp.]